MLLMFTIGVHSQGVKCWQHAGSQSTDAANGAACPAAQCGRDMQLCGSPHSATQLARFQVFSTTASFVEPNALLGTRKQVRNDGGRHKGWHSLQASSTGRRSWARQHSSAKELAMLEQPAGAGNGRDRAGPALRAGRGPPPQPPQPPPPPGCPSPASSPAARPAQSQSPCAAAAPLRVVVAAGAGAR